MRVAKRLYRKDIESIVVKRKQYRNASFTAAKLAEMLGVPNYKLSRIMRAELGVTFSEYVLSRRVEDAKKFLHDSDYAHLTVDDIGVMVGFGNRQSFFDAFRRYAQTSPDKYKKQL